MTAAFFLVVGLLCLCLSFTRRDEETGQLLLWLGVVLLLLALMFALGLTR